MRAALRCALAHRRALALAVGVTTAPYLFTAAAAHCAAPPPAAAAAAAPLHVDADTGLKFPPRDAEGLVLVGTATRYKYSVVKVYAVGLYVDAARAARCGGGAAALSAVQDGELAAGIVIKLARNVAAKDLGEALEASIAPNVRARGARDARDATADLAKLSELGAHLTAALGATLPAGTEVAFRWLGAGDLAVSVNGRPLARFADAPLLCGGFFATYTGATPLIPAARATWLAGIDAVAARA